MPSYITTTEETGADELRRIVNVLNNTRESFNERFSARELVRLGKAYLACGWDFTPDKWTEKQVREALAGKVPAWDDNENPL